MKGSNDDRLEAVRRPRLLILVWVVLAVLASACATAQPAAAPDDAAPAEEQAEEPAPTADDPTPTDTASDSGDPSGPVTVYSGRSEELVGPILEQFTADTGIEVEVRYGDTAEMAATILEEGENSPADLYFGQDAGALGALASEGRLIELPVDILERVEGRFRAQDGAWVGITGRARVLAYNTEAVSEEELPPSVLDLTDERWRGRVSWAPTNGSLQSFVTAMRVTLGDDATRDWLEGMIANDVQVFENNAAQVEAAGRGEVDIALVNHYYLYRFLAEDPDFPVENHYLTEGDIGALVNVAGAGVLDTADSAEGALELIRYLLSDSGQAYFAAEVYEHPLVPGVEADPRLPAIEDISTPDIDLSDLEDLEATLELLRSVGAL